jgi:hypothetical protein
MILEKDILDHGEVITSCCWRASLLHCLEGGGVGEIHHRIQCRSAAVSLRVSNRQRPARLLCGAHRVLAPSLGTLWKGGETTRNKPRRYIN